MIRARSRAPVSRRLARGEGSYLADLPAGDALHAAFARSPSAHATLVDVELGAARVAPGVVAVYTARDFARLGAGTLPVGWTVNGQRPSRTPLLAVGRVRYVGEPVALVVADSREHAEDAVMLARFELEPLPVVDVEAALADDAPLLYPDWGDNVLARQLIDTGDVDATFMTAPVTVAGRYAIARQTGLPMECRGVLVRPDPVTGELVVISSSQSPHHAAEHFAEALGCEQRSVRVIAPDVGGSFGVKDHAAVEEVAVAVAAIDLGQPVRWLQNRREHLIAGVHSRGKTFDLELAADDDGRLLALRGRLLYDAGARSGNHGAGTAVYASLILPGPYVLERYRLETLAVVTNAPPSAAYRGYGSPEATFAMEGMMDRLAHHVGISPAEVRRRNLIAPAQYPYRTATGLTYDAAEPRRALDRALELAADAPDPRPGWRRGVGVGMVVLMGGFGPTRAALSAGMAFGGYETARVRMDRDAHVTVSIGMPTQGQGIETALAQTAAGELGIDPTTHVQLDSADTARVPYSPVGAIASRGAAVGGAAVTAAARRLAGQLRRMAGSLLDTDPDTLVLANGRVSVPPTAAASRSGRSPRRSSTVTLRSLPTRPRLKRQRPLTRRRRRSPTGRTSRSPTSTRGTGAVALVRYVAVSDCGRLINPAIVQGQVEGGIVQGIGGALMEQIRFTDDGQPLSATMFDYLVPTAADVPPLVTELFETPSPITATGARGAGEIGIIGPGAAVAGAVTAAFEGRVNADRLPLTPPRVRALARRASTRRERLAR